ncbi:hypothetical protein [Rariglobus hedericola]|uniref:Uncharacterized protein n=1 Tax=Rariglobus hedericola TaxID=2597822 RepID=A0A556QEQ0_9BACT|nr:hypothetical protein [Rariglobus hedericola]TSJ75115.1 hypothetical protein FPL22_17105 [Rariglobus hedericola]
MKRLGYFLVFALALVVSARAVELSPGLDYLRAGAADSATFAKALETGSVVLDLRYASTKTAAATLSGVKGFRTHPKRIVLVLLSPETSGAARNELSVTIPGCITIGRASADYKTDIIVTTTAEADKRAFDALVADTSPAKLVLENVNKSRFDEATLIHEHETGVETPAPAEAVKSASASETADKPKPLPVDAVLQRAVQIHRGLVALKQL